MHKNKVVDAMRIRQWAFNMFGNGVRMCLHFNHNWDMSN